MQHLRDLALDLLFAIAALAAYSVSANAHSDTEVEELFHDRRKAS